MRKHVFAPRAIGYVLSLACAMLFALCLPAKAQQAKRIPQIGFPRELDSCPGGQSYWPVSGRLA